MSADMLQTDPQRERAELITQAELLHRVVEVQDALYRIEQMIRILQERVQASEQGRPSPTDKNRWEGQAS